MRVLESGKWDAEVAGEYPGSDMSKTLMENHVRKVTSLTKMEICHAHGIRVAAGSKRGELLERRWKKLVEW